MFDVVGVVVEFGVGDVGVGYGMRLDGADAVCVVVVDVYYVLWYECFDFVVFVYY